MAKIITEEEALNYEIFSSSLFGSWIMRIFTSSFYKRAARRYKNYLHGMGMVELLQAAGKIPDSTRAEELLQISIELEKIKDDNALSHQVIKLTRNNQTPEAIRIIAATEKVNKYMALQVCGESLLNRINKYLKHETNNYPTGPVNTRS